MRRVIAVLLFSSGPLGCGYAFQGTTMKALEGVRRINIPPVANSTTYTELTLMLTNKLIQEFSMSKSTKVTSADVADAVLEVKVNYVQISGAARVVTADASASRRALVSVAAKLVRKQDGQVIWESTDLTGRKSYTVSSDQSVVEANRNSALQTVANEIASKIHDGIFEDF